MKWFFLKNIVRLKRNMFVIITLLLVISCNTKVTDGNEINLKWNKSYPEETIEDAEIGLKWCLSFLGSNGAMDSIWTGLEHDKKTFKLHTDKLAFSPQATVYLKQLHIQLKKSEEYQKTNAIDLGRYMAMTIGNPDQYYKITAVPTMLDTFLTAYTFDSIPGYINNSGVSKVHRIISHSKNKTGKKQAYISAEVDSITKVPIEFETVELMENGLSRFGVYDHNGTIKEVADNTVTHAGKVAKCMWCHESGIQPMFRIQLNVPDYLTYERFQDTLTHYGLALRAYQNTIWKDKAIHKRRNHTKMEIAYIAFMEPSVAHLVEEWGLPEEEIRKRVGHMTTHRHEEFDFLGDLYHRSEVDLLAPWKVQKVPESIREKSNTEKTLSD